MTRFSYREQDYAFGQAILTLRTNIGLTQAGLAELLGVFRRAIWKWEAGGAYPKVEHLKALLAFALKQQAFDARYEEEEIRAFWKTSHQKVLLDESWLSTLVSQHHRPVIPVFVGETRSFVLYFRQNSGSGLQCRSSRASARPYGHPSTCCGKSCGRSF